MLLACVLPATAVEAQQEEMTPAAAAVNAVQEPLTLSETAAPLLGEADDGFAPAGSSATVDADAIEVQTPTDAELTRNPKAELEEAGKQGYSESDMVTFIVNLETRPLLQAGFTTSEIASRTDAVVAYEAAQELSIAATSRRVRAKLGDKADVLYTYTIASTGMAVRTNYGSRAALEAMPGVKSVYVAPTFSLPETQEATPSSANAGVMIGGDYANASGFTGKGMKIAILDTGLKVDHPNFAALPENKLTETSLTKEGVDEIWNTLNASKRTNQFNMSYKNTKVPFVFNYDSGSFDVSNTYAGSDHGTHVAGIAAANKISSSEVVGVAPDAQLVIMQVFTSSGGAGWETIMAGLEDAVRLNVDTANLSLGSASGFTDPQDTEGKHFIEVLSLYAESDMEVIIAAGNDTSSAYQNLWGLNMSLTSNPDIGLAGTPSTYSAALSVASVNNDMKKMRYFLFGDTAVGYTDTASSCSFYSRFAAGTELTYVTVPGTGAASDYEGLDVEGKVALVKRGGLSFPEKHANAQAAGASAVIVYDNVVGTMINMQINDSAENIPAIFISKADGDVMAASATGKLTVSDGAQKEFRVQRSVSDFSSWGVTPDLKLKPEIAGVGGDVYSCVDPAISGSNYSSMSGTSMASPNVTGGMTVLMQYLREVYELSGMELRQAAANLAMSTASPLMQGETEYSPRAQGAGLMDLEAAFTAGAYLSNPNASEGRPKAELGDDPEKTGVYDFSFEIKNMQSFAKTYALRASVMTESIYEGAFIANQGYALDAATTFYRMEETDIYKYDFNGDGTVDTADARVLLRHVNGVELVDEADVRYAYLDVNNDSAVNKADVNVILSWCAGVSVDVDLEARVSNTTSEEITSITVGSDETVTVNVRIALTEEDKAYMAAFENGIYVEGYVYVTDETEEVKSLNMPFIGFYGDWSDAPIFDSEDPNEASVAETFVLTWASELGTNPYFATGRGGDEYNAFSYANPLYAIQLGTLRNMRDLKITATDIKTGEVYYTLTGGYLAKTYYNASYGQMIPLQLLSVYGEVWDGKVYKDENDTVGTALPDGTEVCYKIEAWLDDGDDIVDDSFSFNITLDDAEPEVLNRNTLNEEVVARISDSHVLLPLTIEENEHVAAVLFVGTDGSIMGKYEVENTPGEAETFYFDITGYGTDFTVIVADYACNENEFDVSLDLGDFTDAVPTLSKLSKDRLYGCETFDGAAIDGGWFSVNKSDFTDLRNETFDSTKRYYSGEYINGYVIAQSAATGHLELLTPTNTYWKTQTIAQNWGNVGDPGVWVLYDMALDHSGTLSTLLNQRWNESDPTDSLWAVGWYYQGDYNNDGKDDGYNALFKVNFSQWGNEVNAVARIVGTVDNAEILTFGITTDGEMYGISTDAKLYHLEPEVAYDESYNANVIKATYVGTTDFVSYPGYGGANVIQSMGYDHNTGKMYWYAHSQVASGYTYNNYNVTYEVDLKNGKCTEVGTYGPGGQTALFVPNDLESDLFTMGVQPSGFRFDKDILTMAQGQSKRLNVTYQPWNAASISLTWTSDNEDVAAVDSHGKVTALSAGTATISASGMCYTDGTWDWSTGEGVFIQGEFEYTATCTIEVLPSQSELYGFVIEDFSTTEPDLKWVTYPDSRPTEVTDLGQSLVPTQDENGDTVMSPAMWAGGAYYGGYVYTVLEEVREDENGGMGTGTGLYKSKVTKAEDGSVTVGEPEFIGFQIGMNISAMAFDYNTSRMYCIENKYIGGLGIMDLDTGAVDMLGLPTGDLYGAVYIPSMCVLPDGSLVISDAVANLYTMNPDTLETKQIYTGNGDSNSAYYEAMHYDYETGNIYWNMCDGTGASPLYLVRMPEFEWEEATIVNLGGVSSKKGTQQTVIFSMPENEPEAKLLPVSSIEITNGEAVTGLLGGSLQLNTVTEPARPTVRTRTWSSSNESVVTVDSKGVISYVGLGTATVTVSITNKDEATYGGPFTDTIEVSVKESAGEFVAFLNDDSGSQYYDFWLRGNDYDLRHTEVEESMINTYSLRCGVYYDGFYYAYNDKGDLLRINPNNPADFKTLGSCGLNYQENQVTSLAMDYTTGTLYGITLPSTYSNYYWTSRNQVGLLVKVSLDDGSLTTVAELDFSKPVYSIVCDGEGQLYAAGGSFESYESNKLFKLNKETGELTDFMTLEGLNVFTGNSYYQAYYNTQMTYDWGTNRIYFYATIKSQYYSDSYGMWMIELGGEEPALSYIEGISLVTRGTLKYGDVYLGMLAFLPETDELPKTSVNGINIDKPVARVEVGETVQLNAVARPSYAENAKLTWKSENEAIATVDATGLVTGVAAGETNLVVTSDDSGVSLTVPVTVVSLEGPQPIAYTVSANKDALISFNPNLPSKTTVVTTLSGGNKIVDMAAGDGCLYYLVDSTPYPYLYRLDLSTNESIALGALGVFTTAAALEYDPVNNLFFVGAGFYTFVYDGAQLDPNVTSWEKSYSLDPDYCEIAGIFTEGGTVYTIGNDFNTKTPFIRSYPDATMQSSTLIVNKILGLDVVQGVSDFSYDPATKTVYMADGSSTLHTFKLDDIYTDAATGKNYLPTETIDMIGDGSIDVNGLVVFSAKAE